MKKLRPNVETALASIAALRTGENSAKAVRDTVERALNIVRDPGTGRRSAGEWVPTNLIGFGRESTRVYGASKLFAPRPEMTDSANAVREAAGVVKLDPAAAALKFSRTVADGDLADLAKRVNLSEEQLKAGLGKMGLMTTEAKITIRVAAKDFKVSPEVAEKAEASVKSALGCELSAKRPQQEEGVAMTR